MTLTLPLLAEGRAGGRVGGGGFSGSRSGGYRSTPYQGGGYNRPRSSYGPGAYNPRPAGAVPYAAARGSSGSFFSGLFSGLLGAWLYSKVFHSDTAAPATTATQPQNMTNRETPVTAPASPNISFFRILLMAAVIYFIWRIVRRRRRNTNDTRSNYFSGNDVSAQRKMNLHDYVNTSTASQNASQNLMANVSTSDRNQFENILLKIQNAWTQMNMSELQRYTAPEMFQNFADIIRENQQQGVSNYISQVKLLNMELQDMWQEGDMTFIRTALTWSAIDYSVNNTRSPNDAGYLLEGDMNQPSVVTEIWTFKREGQEPWKLADIEQD